MGNSKLKPNRHKMTQTGECHKVRFGSSEMQGWRLAMEDAKLVNLSLDSSTMIFGVFDGHGGHEVSSFVSRHFTFSLLSSTHYSSSDISSALTQSFLSMDNLLKSSEGSQELIRISRSLPSNYPVNNKDSSQTVGCTAIVALLRDKELFVANAGDSRCVLNRGGLALDLSIDHKPSLVNEKQRIVTAGGQVIDGRINRGLNLSRSIGDFAYKSNEKLPLDQQMVIATPDIFKIDIQEDDKFIVLACDGVWERLSSQECVEIIDERLGSQGLGNICEEILDRCIAPNLGMKLGYDNMTIIIVVFKHPFD